jgi:hypothetical protein
MCRHTSLVRLAVATAVALCFAGPGLARADFADFNFTTTVSAQGGNPAGFNGATTVTGSSNSGGSVTLTALDGSGMTAPTDIDFGRLSSVPPGGNNTDDYDFTYDFKLQFTVDPMGMPTTFSVDITGGLKGTLFPTSPPLMNTFDRSEYTVDVPGLGTYSISNLRFSSDTGTFTAHVEAVPEPASIVLLGAGALALLGRSRSRRRVLLG